jgi:hypothetical protein
MNIFRLLIWIGAMNIAVWSGLIGIISLFIVPPLGIFLLGVSVAFAKRL